MLQVILLAIILFMCLNKDKYRISNNMIIGLSLVAIYFMFISKERFALPSDNSILTDINALDDNKFYNVGAIKPDSQIKTTRDALGNGAKCLSFPNNVYKVVPDVAADCSIPNGTDANAVKQANVDTNYTFNTRIISGKDIKTKCFSDINSGVSTVGIGNTANSCPNVIVSPNKKFRLEVQPDGNLVIIDQTPGQAEKAILQSGSAQPKDADGKYLNAPYFLKQQPEGHLVLYNSKGGAIWSTGNYGVGVGPYELRMNDDGTITNVDSKGLQYMKNGNMKAI